MTNTQELRRKIKENGYKYAFVAGYLGLTAYGFQRKVCNVSQFKADEIQKLCVLLKLTEKERTAIFLPDKLNLNHLKAICVRIKDFAVCGIMQPMKQRLGLCSFSHGKLKASMRVQITSNFEVNTYRTVLSLRELMKITGGGR